VKIARARGRKAVVIRNKKQLQFQTVVLIAALEQAIGYQSRPQSNDPAPELYRILALENPANLRDIKALVVELRRLNDLLEKAIVKSDLRPGVGAFVLQKLPRSVRSPGLIFKTEERHRRGLICFE
jgi:hypothetical protein